MYISPENFKEAFLASFVANRRHLLWDTKARRTAQMTAYVYRTIADCFGETEIEYEYRDIDAIIYNICASPEEAVVAIEHENHVQSIGKELANLLAFNRQLSVVITYTGLRSEYLGRHMDVISQFGDGKLMLVVNREDWNPDSHKRGNPIPWEFLVYRGGNLVSI